MRSVRNKNGFRIISMGDCSKKKGNSCFVTVETSSRFLAIFHFVSCFLLVSHVFVIAPFVSSSFLYSHSSLFAIFLLYNPIGIFLFSCSNFRSILCVFCFIFCMRRLFVFVCFFHFNFSLCSCFHFHPYSVDRMSPSYVIIIIFFICFITKSVTSSTTISLHAPLYISLLSLIFLLPHLSSSLAFLILFP